MTKPVKLNLSDQIDTPEEDLVYMIDRARTLRAQASEMRLTANRRKDNILKKRIKELTYYIDELQAYRDRNYG